jgi:hypothetical protein
MLAFVVAVEDNKFYQLRNEKRIIGGPAVHKKTSRQL